MEYIDFVSLVNGRDLTEDQDSFRDLKVQINYSNNDKTEVCKLYSWVAC